MTSNLRGLTLLLQGFPPQASTRRSVIAGATSIVVHVGFLTFLLWQPDGAIRGNFGLRNGVDGEEAGSDPVFAELIAQYSAGQSRKTSSLSATHNTPEPEMLAPANTGERAQAAESTFVETSGPAAKPEASGGAVPGAPDGQHALLEQIARCLPPGERPDLKVATLSLNLDVSGHLTAAPRLMVDVTRLTETQLRSANQIIQAAMQCGPYVVTQGEVAMIDIVPDFTGIPMAER